MLKSAGYRTGAFVGAFVLDARFGLNRGFDVYDDRYGEKPRAIRPKEPSAAQKMSSARGRVDPQARARLRARSQLPALQP